MVSPQHNEEINNKVSCFNLKKTLNNYTQNAQIGKKLQPKTNIYNILERKNEGHFLKSQVNVRNKILWYSKGGTNFKKRVSLRAGKLLGKGATASVYQVDKDYQKSSLSKAPKKIRTDSKLNQELQDFYCNVNISEFIGDSKTSSTMQLDQYDQSYNDQKDYAVKIFEKKLMQDKTKREHLQNEIDIISVLNNPYCINFHSVRED